jgi:SAM-dependent methyltransferase
MGLVVTGKPGHANEVGTSVSSNRSDAEREQCRARPYSCATSIPILRTLTQRTVVDFLRRSYSRRYVSTSTPRASPWSAGSTTKAPETVEDSATPAMSRPVCSILTLPVEPPEIVATCVCHNRNVEYRWTAGVTALRCPACGRVAGQELLATVDVPWRDEPVEIARCGGCDAVVLSAVQPPSAYSHKAWDLYVEHLAGIEAIADMLAKVGAPAGARMLDVGCGYGFGLDIAQVLFGWEGIGLDPSVAAGRGRAELDLDIRSGTLEDAFEPDERFDVIFASEVLEHVPDPRAFLASVHRRLSDRGVFLMTTPDAGAVRPETPMTVLYPALSVGAHEFLLARDGLERMLGEAGFASRVWAAGATLFALASRSREALQVTRPSATVHADDLIRYCDIRAERSEPGSALSVGMTSRRLKFAVNGNEYAVAAAGTPRLRQAVRERYDIDLDDPSTDFVVADGQSALVVIHYFLGILALNHENDPHSAARHFAAAAAVGKAQFELYGLYVDPETALYEFLSLAHRALALAQFDPDDVPEALTQMDEAVARGAASPELAREYRARAQPGRVTASRAYRRLARSRVPGVSTVARGVRRVLVRS